MRIKAEHSSCNTKIKIGPPCPKLVAHPGAHPVYYVLHKAVALRYYQRFFTRMLMFLYGV